MTRTLVTAGVAITLMALASSDLSACGDKSLSAGGIRMQRALAARYRANVLIYTPSGSRMQGAAHELKLQETLLKVGHRYREVSSHDDFRAAAATGQFNIVLADVADVANVQQQLESVSSPASVIAVAYKLSKSEITEAARVCRFVINAPGHAARYLTTIADAVRSKGAIPRKA